MPEKMFRQDIKISGCHGLNMAHTVSKPVCDKNIILKTCIEMNDCEAFVMHNEKCLIGV